MIPHARRDHEHDVMLMLIRGYHFLITQLVCSIRKRTLPVHGPQTLKKLCLGFNQNFGVSYVHSKSDTFPYRTNLANMIVEIFGSTQTKMNFEVIKYCKVIGYSISTNEKGLKY